MSILKFSPAAIEPPSSDSQSAGGAGALPEAPFAAVLHDERARSAGTPDIPGGSVEPDVAEAGETPPADATATGAGTDPAAAALAALLGGAVPARPVAVTDVEPAVVPGSESLPATATATASPAVTPATGETSPVPGAPATMPAATAPAAPGTPATGTGLPGEQLTTPTSADTNPQSVAPVTAPAPDSAPPPSLPDAPHGEASNMPSAATPVPTADASTGGGADTAPQNPPAAAPPQSAPATPAAAAPAPLDAGSPVSSTSLPPSRTVGLDRTVETVRLALRAASDRGVTHARISLSPRELGGIEINLRHTPDGIVARVVAEHGGAAQLLQHAATDLRRALEAQGLTLLQLDIGSSGEQSGRAAGEQRGFGEAGTRRDTAGDATDDGSSTSGDSRSATSDTTLALSNGVLVDVLA